MSLLLLALLYPMVQMARGPYHYIASGDMFSHRFDPRYDVGALDEPGLQDGYFFFTAMSVILFPFVVLVRCAGDRTNRFGYWAILAPVLGIAACLLVIFLPALYLMAQYVSAMGFTQKRVAGLIYGGCGILAVIAVVAWVAWPSRKVRTYEEK